MRELLEGRRNMEVIIKSEAKEIADLVLALQGQRNQSVNVQLELDGKKINSPIHGGNE